MVNIGEHFRSDESGRHSEWLRQQRWFFKAQQDQQKRADANEKLAENILSVAVDAILASHAQVVEFQTRLDLYESRLDEYDAKLDAYDAAIVEALMLNRERLDALLLYREQMLSEAYVLEDGRRVFKSEDGTVVRDEFGIEVPADELDPALIGSHRPSLETFFGNEDAIIAAQQEREALLDAQQEVANAREHSAEAREALGEAREVSERDGLTVDEIEELEANLDQLLPTSLPTLPLAAARQLSGGGEFDTAPELKAEFLPTAKPSETTLSRAPIIEPNTPN